MPSNAERKGENKRSLQLGRRGYMKLTGAVVTGSAVGTTQIGRARAATHHGITFDRVVDAVADLGCDPKGNADVSSKVESALDGQTLVEFPSGTYHWDGSVTLDTDRIGIRGTSDDVLFTFPAGYNQFFINGSCEQALYENFDVDIQPENTATGIRVASERGFHIENIEHIGRGTADSSDVTRCWQLRVNDPDATGVVKNFVAKKGSAWAHYKGGDGRVGISIYGGEGTIKVIDCHLEEFGNNGIYASRSLSSVQVEGGTYRNNNVAGIRFSGKGSYVDGTTIEVDPSKYSGPRTREDDSFKMRGIVVEQGNSDTGGFDDAGAQIRNTDIIIQDNPTTGQAISMWTGGRTLAVSNTRIVYNNDGAPAIYREGKTSQGSHSASSGARWLRMDTVQITGAAAEGPTILAEEADNTQIKNSYIEQTGDERQGVVLSDSADTLVQNSVIEVNAKAVSLDSSSGQSKNIRHSGKPLPKSVGAPSSTPNSPQKAADEVATSAPNTDTPSKEKDMAEPDSSPKQNSGESKASKKTEHTLEIEGAGSKSSYSFAVDGQVNPNKRLGRFDTGDDTFVGDNWVSGFVVRYSDGFTFTGSIIAFTLEGDATVRIDGEEVDPNTLGDSEQQHTLVIDGQTPKKPTSYSFTVDGSLTKGSHADMDDTVNKSSACGTVDGYQDSFQFSGQIVQFDIDGDAAISFEK